MLIEVFSQNRQQLVHIASNIYYVNYCFC